MRDGTVWRWLLPLSATLVLLVVLVLLLPAQPDDWATFFVSRETRPWLFLALMTALPAIGFPIVPFLVLVGVKFGVLLGFAATAGTFLVHALVSYALTHSVLRPFIWRVLARTRYELPEIHERRVLVFSVVFIAVPALPYAIKNYALALLNVPFRIYLPVVWSINLLLAAPFVGLGHVLLAEPRYAWIFVAVLVAGYFLAIRLKRQYASAPKPATARRSSASSRR